MLINDFQGVPSLPEPIDDDFITTQGMFTQPPTKPSVLAGVVIVSQLFRILSECFFHHRCLASAINSQNEAFGQGTSKIVPSRWAEKAEARLHKILNDDMPDVIQHPELVMHSATGGYGGMTVEGTREVFAMQRANIWITAAIVKFALVRCWTAHSPEFLD
jgi:hypothetical protein